MCHWFNRPKKTSGMLVGHNSAYAVNLTYDRHTPTYRQHIYIYHAKSRLNTPVWGSLRSPNYKRNKFGILFTQIYYSDGLLSVYTDVTRCSCSYFVVYLIIGHFDYAHYFNTLRASSRKRPLSDHLADFNCDRPKLGEFTNLNAIRACSSILSSST